MRVKSVISILTICFLSFVNVNGQQFANNEAEYDSIYAVNVKKTKINGVYIPKDIEDAHKRILKLTPVNDIKKFMEAPEIEVCEKLHFGIGRWMIHNWNFYEGSRLSQYLKEKGLTHPDDMANFLLRSLHRHMNKQTPNQDEIIEELVAKRKKEVQKMINR